MKRRLGSLLIFWCAAVNIFGQGIVAFDNRVGDQFYWVFYPDCLTKVSGDAFQAQLYAAPSGASVEALVPVGPAVSFRSGAAEGLWNPIAVEIPFVPPGQHALLQTRVWEAGADSYESAVAAGMLRGTSRAFETQTALGSIFAGTPADLFGMGSFCLVPEPSTWALSLLGIGLLMTGSRFRRECRRQSPQRQRFNWRIALTLGHDFFGERKAGRRINSWRRNDRNDRNDLCSGAKLCYLTS